MQRSGSIQDRLGVRQVTGRRMRRGGQNNNNGIAIGQAQRGRSRSRTRLNRNNFTNNAANPVQFRRSNSLNTRLGNNGPAAIANNQNGRRRMRSRSRNGVNNKNQFININRPQTGRIIKRKINRNVAANNNQVQRGQRRPNTFGNAAARNAKKLQRWIL